MTINPQIPIEPSQGVVLQPSHQLPLIIMALGLVFLPLPIYPWPSLVISGFGLFLLLQSFILKVEFTPNDFVVWQFGLLIVVLPLLLYWFEMMCFGICVLYVECAVFSVTLIL